MEFGWKARAERLRMVMLSAGHQHARELGPGLLGALAIFARAAAIGDLLVEPADVAHLPLDEYEPLWESIEVHGWKIQATMYLRDDQLWWLLHASRKNERSPSDKDVLFLDKILGHLGAESDHHAIICPRSSPAGAPLWPFGWWAWRNGWLLYEVQVNKDKARAEDKVRVVPRGTRETDGYTRLREDDVAADEEPR